MNSSYSLYAVERAVCDLRRGLPIVLIHSDGEKKLVYSGEHYPDRPFINDGNSPAVHLMKIGGLLPHAVVAPITASSQTHDFLSVNEEDVLHYPMALAHTVTRVSEANVPLPNARNARFIAFRPRFGHEEHLAIVIGDISHRHSPLVRLHSSCITGDIFASMRCDCGTQLQHSIRRMSEHGSGIVLYLNQEGRGIGIANKLRAYTLQDGGLDTVDANLALGYEADERNFAVAAAILKQLGVQKITLLTNNPMKIDAITKEGIIVKNREPVQGDVTEHNGDYLRVKAQRMGHILPVSCPM